MTPDCRRSIDMNAFRSNMHPPCPLGETGENLSRVSPYMATELDEHHADLSLGLVDTVVMAIAERLDAQAMATLDLRDFAPVELAGSPALWPRDL